MKYLIIISLFFSCTTRSYDGNVKRVIDGDTFELTTGQIIRLYEVDAPEITQTYGIQAKNFVVSYLSGKHVKLIYVDTDNYGRQVCKVYLDSVYFNEQLVKAGLAWVYPQYGSRELYNEQLQARAAKIGLWALNGQISPYQYRKRFKNFSNEKIN